MKDKTKIQKHWYVLAVVCLMYGGTLGLVNNTIGVYYTPVTESLNMLRGTFAMNATISSLATGVISLFAPKILQTIGWKRTIGIGSTLATVGIFGMSLTVNPWVFNLLGAFRGAGVGLTAMVPAATIVNNWFHEKNGLALSLMTAFSGIGGAVVSPIFAYLIEQIGWEKTFQIHGLMIFILCLPSLLYSYTLHPEAEGLRPYGSSEIPRTTAQSTEGIEKQIEIKDYLGYSFFAFIAIAFLQTFIVGMNQHLPSYGVAMGMSTQTAGYVLSAVMFGNISFKLFSGSLSDKFGEIIAMLVIIGLNILSLVLSLVWTTPGGLIISFWMFGSIFGTAVLYILLSTRFFGVSAGSYAYSQAIFAANIAVALSNALIGYVYDFTGTYRSIFIFAIIIQVLVIICLYVAEKYAPKKKREQD